MNNLNIYHFCLLNASTISCFSLAKTIAAFSKASARERSPTKQYLCCYFLLFSRRTFAGARFAELSTGVMLYDKT